MKKLILMLLLVVGGVMSSSAATVKKRIYVVADGNFQTYCTNTGKDNACLGIHVWYADNSGAITTWTTAMSFCADNNKWQNNSCLYFYDLTFDDTKVMKFKVFDKNNPDGWASPEIELNPDKYYHWTTSSNQNKLEAIGDVEYCAYLNNTTKVVLTTSDNVSFTGTINNLTSFNSDAYLEIAPTFVIDDTWVNYANLQSILLYRPADGNQNPGFSVLTDAQGGCYKNSTNSLKLSAAAFYNITFKPYDWTFSVEPYIPCEVTSVGYSTFSSNYDVTIPSGVTASYITGVNGNNLISEAYNGTIKAGDAALLQASEGTYQFTPATSASAVSENMLVAVATRIEGLSATTGDKTNYILTNQTVNGVKNVGFYKANNSNVAAGKAYLQLPTVSTARDFFSLWDQETTSINSVEKVQEGNVIFNLNGQRVNNATKGLYIVNGKKVMFK